MCNEWQRFIWKTFQKNLSWRAKVEKENISDTKASLLIIDLDIKDRKNSSKFYDKRFEIVRISFFNSNIPSKVFILILVLRNFV